MAYYRVHHSFHPVGHGTFFTGEVASSDGDLFRWVYDCGSRSTRRIEAQIERLRDWPYLGCPDCWHAPWEDRIDMVVVSHFDGDHVNGLEQLLREFHVRHLVLPWLGLRERLAHAASLDNSEESSSASIAGFAIDPRAYLVARGLSDRVEQIVLVQSGRGGDGAFGEPVPLPDPDEHEPNADERSRYSANTITGMHYSDAGAEGGPRFAVVSDSVPFRIISGQALELVFFNTAPPDGIANRSKQPIDLVRAQIDQILRHHGVLDVGSQKRSGWRTQLRKCYDQHFGTSSGERNNISLCALVRPLAQVHPYYCLSGWHHGWQSHQSTAGLNGSGLLLTGDITLDVPTIDAMQRHFNAARWRGLGVVQVPHHGSRHSWFAGNAAHFPDPEFVHCVPSKAGKYPRPHPIVVADLAQSRVLHADDEFGVSQCYVI